MQPAALCVAGVSACLFTALQTQVPRDVASAVNVDVAVERVQSESRTLRLVALVTPAPGLHVYAPGNPGFVPVDFTVERRQGLRVGPLQLPAAQEFLFNLGEVLKGFSRPFRMTRTVTFDSAGSHDRSANRELKGTLTYQACTESICLRSTSVGLKWQIPR